MVIDAIFKICWVFQLKKTHVEPKNLNVWNTRLPLFVGAIHNINFVTNSKIFGLFNEMFFITSVQKQHLT